MASIHSESPAVANTAMDRRVQIDGIQIPEIVTPESPAETASILAEADSSGKAVAPIGGGTKLALGNVPTRLEVGVSTLKLNQVIHYEPTDMTLSIGAGTRFGDVQALLAERGQTLPIETADESQATIGGLIATAFAGPRRLGSGTLRDLLIGISVAYPNGTIGKAGGLVVKNVTGFDLMRLHLGALGTLGFIISANFKVLPLPRTEATMVSEPMSLEAALAMASSVRRGRLRPVAIEVFRVASDWMVAARFEGRVETVELGVASVQSLGPWEHDSRGEESKNWWRRYVDRQSIAGSGGDIAIRCGVTPKDVGTLAGGIEGLLRAHDISPELCAVSPGLGTMVMRFEPGAVDSDGLKVIQQKLVALATTVTILDAPSELKSHLDVWGPVPETVAVMRALKTEFDPNNVLNPGRFVDRI